MHVDGREKTHELAQTSGVYVGPTLLLPASCTTHNATKKTQTDRQTDSNLSQTELDMS